MIELQNIYYKLFETYGKQNWWPAKHDIEIMIGAVLVQNTNWSNVEKSLKLFKSFEGNEILNLKEEELKEKIRVSGSFNRKSKTVFSLLKWFKTYNFDTSLLKNYSTEILRNEILSIYGIGEETCDCILLYVFDRPVFVVDSYLKRLLKKTGHPEMKSYSEIQNYIMKNLPNDVEIFKEYHALIVKYGKIHLRRNIVEGLKDPLNFI
jgi:putative endonuclease MJ1434